MGTIREPATVLDSKLLGISESGRVIEGIIIAALKQENVCGIGVYGLDEVDNAGLTKKIGEKVKGESSFNVVVTGSFGAASNETLSHLIVKEKILIVLNDVPDILDIEKVGILLQMHKGSCKILMMSQFKGVFMAMGAHNIFAAQGKEVWIVCRDNIDYTSALPDLYGLARSIAEEYKGLPFAPSVVDRISRDNSKLRPKALAERFLIPDLSYVSELQHKMVAQGLVHSYPKLRIQAIAGSAGANSQYGMNEMSFYSTSSPSTVTKETEMKKEEIDREAKLEVSVDTLAEKVLNPNLSHMSEPEQEMVVQGSVRSSFEQSNQTAMDNRGANLQYGINEKSFCSTSRQNIVAEESRRQKEKIGHETKLEVFIDVLLADKRYVKDCMLFCSIFPSGYAFTKDMLVWQWIAQGLIKSEEDDVMEKAYIQCFDALLNSGFIVALGCDLYDEMKYKFGDKMTAFLEKQLLEPKFQRQLDNEQTDVAKVEHLSLAYKDIDSINFEVLKQCSHLQSLTIYRCYGSKVKRLPTDLFTELKALKILNLIHTNVKVFPGSIEDLKELRYLDLSNTPTRYLSNSMCCFSSLQTLLLDHCGLYDLPQSMNKLINLRHLGVNVSQLGTMPVDIGKLSKLRMLRAFMVGVEDGSRIGELKDLNELKGSLHILYLEHVKTKEEAAEACLCNKQNLKKIELQWIDFRDEKNTNEEEILESLRPPLGLQELRMISYSGGVLPSWISNPLFSELVSVSLYRCRYCDSLPSLGELPSLKILNIVKNNEMTEINSLFCRKQNNQHHVAFPKLEKLSFIQMSKLEKWTGLKNGDFPHLHSLEMEDCPKFVVLPSLSHLSSLSEMMMCYCPALSCFPEGGLPPTLQFLWITDCPKLKERCCNEGCEDWSKVVHVSTFYIDGHEVSL